MAIGPWAVALLLENAGIPVPGETILLLASFLAYSRAGVAASLDHRSSDDCGHDRRQPWICIGLLRRTSAVGALPAFLQNSTQNAARGERLFARYGAVTIFFARFVFGMRIIAGPMAGVLRMPWRKFMVFNFLGAAVWVTVISGAGYLFGQHWGRLVKDMKRFDIAIAAVVLLSAAILWWRHRRKV